MRRLIRGARVAVAGLCATAVLPALAVAFAPHAAAVVNPCSTTSYGIHRYAPGVGKTVALTFDDGPGSSTEQLMRILSGAHVEATFFNIGSEEANRPALVRREYTNGFALGDHTWDHAEMIGLDRTGQEDAIDRERALQASITGRYSCLFRPPYGEYDDATLEVAQERGMTVWTWSVDTEDWRAAGSSDPYWVDRITKRATAGGVLAHPVILLHNMSGGNPATVAALPAIIRYYKVHGYRFVDLYGHTGQPVIGRVAPTSGKTAGGTRVTITGHGFLGVRGVRFGRSYGTSITVESYRRLTVTSPPHLQGVVNVRVVTTFGTSPKSEMTQFSYVAPPTVTSVTPRSGPTAGGTRVTVTGARFRGVVAVRFGVVSGTHVRVISTSALRVTAPPHFARTVNVRVVTAYGTSARAAADRYTYVAEP